MVLTAGGMSKAKDQPKMTPFKHWFNKNQGRLQEEYTGDPDKFMDWAAEEFEKK